MNAKTARPQLVLELDRPRSLTFDFRAGVELEKYFEQETGERRLWKAIDWQEINLREASRILWACLLSDAEDHNEVLTYEAVLKLISMHEIIGSLEKLLAFLEDVFDRAQPVFEDKGLAEAIDRFQKKTSAMKAAGSSGSSSTALESSPSDSAPANSGD